MNSTYNLIYDLQLIKNTIKCNQEQDKVYNETKVEFMQINSGTIGMKTISKFSKPYVHLFALQHPLEWRVQN